jgi:UDP-N-acetyl-alpha-D-muramoyl-L-alanyl-L-glutamate epimerase
VSTFGPGGRFSYVGHALDPDLGTLVCRYSLDGRSFTERFELGAGRWGTPAAAEAARLVYLLAGVSYYKTGAPPVIEIDVPLRPRELGLLGDFYRDGLGEFAYRNDLDLTGLEFRAEVDAAPPVGAETDAGPLIPFGGGIDSIVTVESVKPVHPDATLFVVGPPAGSFKAIDRVVPLTGLPVARAVRHLDPQLFEGQRAGFLQGHVPITGIVTAVATLVACGRGRDAVVMSNEWSASSGNLVVGERLVNHQYSKGWAFEAAFAEVVADALGPRPAVFSFLRPYTEVWVAKRFAALAAYHPSFHSCNRAFAVDPAARLERWCGECDKCCFIDLILAPFVARVELETIFGGREPLGRVDLADRFNVLVGLSPNPKPFECVGEVSECRAAAVLAAARGDRQHDQLLQRLAAALPSVGPAEVTQLLSPRQPHHVPDEYAVEDQLV